MNVLQPLVSAFFQSKALKQQQQAFQGAGANKASLQSMLEKLKQQNLYSNGSVAQQQQAFASLLANFDTADSDGDGLISQAEWQAWQTQLNPSGLSSTTGWKGLLERLLMNQQQGNTLGARVQGGMPQQPPSGANPLPLSSLNQRMQTLLQERYTSLSDPFSSLQEDA